MSRVLLADDDTTLLDLCARLLENAGHQVLVGYCVEEALRLVPAADVVIMDLRFRNADGHPDAQEGLSLIRRIRDSGCGAPVIVMSGWPEELHGSPEQTLVARVMIKPVRIDALLAAIRDLVT